VSDIPILNFWNNEYDKYPPQLRNEAIAPVLNKIGLLLASVPLRNIVGQECRTFRMQEVLDRSKILICNLSKGQIGEDASALLGSMILTAIQSAALFRASYQPYKRTPFYLYIDEMHSFVTLSFADILAESRKYGLSLFLTHQYIEQLDERIRAAIFGNVGTIISFRIGAKDAECVAAEFHPVFSQDDLVNLPRYSMYLKLMIDGATSKPFSATTLPLQNNINSFRQIIVRHSRKTYGRNQAEVEASFFSRYPEKKLPREQTLF